MLIFQNSFRPLALFEKTVSFVFIFVCQFRIVFFEFLYFLISLILLFINLQVCHLLFERLLLSMVRWLLLIWLIDGWTIGCLVCGLGLSLLTLWHFIIMLWQLNTWYKYNEVEANFSNSYGCSIIQYSTLETSFPYSFSNSTPNTRDCS